MRRYGGLMPRDKRNSLHIYWKENANNWYPGCRIELYNDSDNNIVNQSNVPVSLT